VSKLISQLRDRLAELSRSVRRMVVIGWCVGRLAAAVVFCLVVHHTRPSEALARRLAPALSRLGTTSIKLGQLIASSTGTFPAALVLACSDLRNNVETDGRFDVRSWLATELGEHAGRLLSVEVTPIAAASIAQVHVGQFDDGTRVAIKVQRHGVARTLATDLRLLTSLSRILARLFPSLRRLNITEVMATLASQLRSELDFVSELHHAEVLRSALEGTGIRVPRCFEGLSTANVFVMEYLPGQALSVCAPQVGAAGAGPTTARRVLEALLRPLSTHGVFHADMHGGNLLVGPDGGLGMVDFGCVTQLDEETRRRLAGALLALFERRFQEAACSLLGLMDVTQADLASAQEALVAVTSTYLDCSIEDLPVGLLIKQLISIGTCHGIVMPVALLSFMRQMLFLDGITRDLDPTFNFLDEGAAVLRAAMTVPGPAVASESDFRPVVSATVRHSPRICGGAPVRSMTARGPQGRTKANGPRRSSRDRSRRSGRQLATSGPSTPSALRPTRRR